MDSTKQTAVEIRATLALAGFSARTVSVRFNDYTTDASIVVTLRDASALDRLPEIQQIASSFARVDRDKAGNILAGGNLYVRVDAIVARAVADRAIAVARAMFAEVA